MREEAGRVAWTARPGEGMRGGARGEDRSRGTARGSGRWGEAERPRRACKREIAYPTGFVVVQESQQRHWMTQKYRCRME